MPGEYILYAMRMQCDVSKNKNLKLVRAEILKRFYSQSLYRYWYRFTVCGPQPSSLWLSKLHSLLETVYRIKKKFPSCERRYIERGSSQSERNSINPCFRFLPWYYVIFIKINLYAIVKLFLFHKSGKNFLVLSTFFKSSDLSILE